MILKEGKEKWTSAVHLIIYLMDYPEDGRGEEQENWVRTQEEHLIREIYYSLMWVVSEFVKCFSFKVMKSQNSLSVSWMAYM